MIEVSSASDIGRVRTSNEDSYGVFSPAVYVVADGLGGHAAGEVASRIVVAAVHDMANEGAPMDTAALKSAVLRANAQVLSAAARVWRTMHTLGTAVSIFCGAVSFGRSHAITPMWRSSSHEGN